VNHHSVRGTVSHFRIRAIKVRAPARIHCALLNESGSFGRVDGSVGFALDDPAWEIELAAEKKESNIEILAEQHRGTLAFVFERFKRKFRFPHEISARITSAIPPHIGLGSKTSFVMALGWGITRLLGVEWDPLTIASFLKRGGTSGLGVHAFLDGGFIWDAGRRFPEQKGQFGPSSECLAQPPQKVMSMMPDGLIIVHFRFAQQGLFGIKEVELFRTNCPVALSETERALTVLSGQLIPSLVDDDDEGLQSAISTLQSLGLKQAEWSTQAEETLKFRRFWHKTLPDVALGLSSAGPTMYCVTRNPDRIEAAINSYDARPIHLTKSKLYAGAK
jgi:beta-ribofuranosylaminobenzene 5'-phosphate synthase